jgi:hypothetical protein
LLDQSFQCDFWVVDVVVDVWIHISMNP